MAWRVTLIATGIRTVIEAVFGADQAGELTYLGRLVTVLGEGMLLLGDRNFAVYKLFAQTVQIGADFLIRGKTGSGAMRLPPGDTPGRWLPASRPGTRRAPSRRSGLPSRADRAQPGRGRRRSSLPHPHGRGIPAGHGSGAHDSADFLPGGQGNGALLERRGVVLP